MVKRQRLIDTRLVELNQRYTNGEVLAEDEVRDLMQACKKQRNKDRSRIILASILLIAGAGVLLYLIVESGNVFSYYGLVFLAYIIGLPRGIYIYVKQVKLVTEIMGKLQSSHAGLWE